jgi:type IV secretory pathway VirB10-like protein
MADNESKPEVDSPKPVDVDKPANKPAETKPAGITFTEEQLSLAKLTQKQKKRLGILPTKFLSEKAKQRNEMLRERMIKLNEERRKAKEASEPKAKETKRKEPSPPPSPKKEKKRPPPPSSSESESEDPYIQRKAEKISKTLKTLTKVEEQLQTLKKQNAHNPFFNLLIK